MSTELVPPDDSQVMVREPEPASMLAVIERAANNPAMDVEKMERLLALHERIVARQAEEAFNNALAECQKQMRSISPDGVNPQTRSKYVTYSKLDSVLRPIYSEHGFSISYNTATTDKPECIRVIALLSRGGHTRTYQIDMPADGKGAKGGDVMTKTHAAGAAMSYGARYLLKSIFNVAVGEEDDDGNLGNRPKPKGPSNLGGDKPLTASDADLKRKLIDLLRDTVGLPKGYNLSDADRELVGQWLIDECVIGDTETLADLAGQRLADVVKKVEEKMK